MADMAALKPLTGRWSTAITMIHPPEASGTVYHALDTYRWLRGGHVLIHEIEARMGDDVIHSLEIYTLQNGQIVSRNFDGRGAVADYKAAMIDGVWRIDGETERFESTLIAADCIEGLWRLKTDDGWIDWMTVRLDRVS
jgi:hypothetical protein